MRQFNWDHPWSNAADTYLAKRLQERYLYAYPGIGEHKPVDPRPKLVLTLRKGTKSAWITAKWERK